MKLLKSALMVGAIAGVSFVVHAQQNPPDTILTNGKIITVDETFSIAQAVAVQGSRIVAVGSNQEITRLAGPATRRIDLRGRAVVPGMIDNHAHFQEEGEYWFLEQRLDGVDTRKQALALLVAKAKEKGPGQWVFTLGGWSPDQFKDDKKPFTRDELDKYLPNNPVLLQFTRAETYLNSKAIEMIGLEKRIEPWIYRDPSGRATGIVENAGAGAVRNAAGFLKVEVPKAAFEASQMKMLGDLAAAGLTASGGSCDFEDIYKGWAKEGRLSMRFFCFRTPQGATPEERFAAIPKLRYHDGDEWIDHSMWGEGLAGGDDASSDRAAVSVGRVGTLGAGGSAGACADPDPHRDGTAGRRPSSRSGEGCQGHQHQAAAVDLHAHGGREREPDRTDEGAQHAHQRSPA
jgi:hypothetical protein